MGFGAILTEVVKAAKQLAAMDIDVTVFSVTSCPGRSYTTLGTDRFGRSDTRAALRNFLEWMRRVW